MRVAPLLLSLLLALAGCAEDSSPTLPPSPKQPPETARTCGELEGVEPVEPVINGQYPVPSGDGGSCPIFAPVPCTRPFSDYVPLCGTECIPVAATNADGDQWLMGCAWRGPPSCSGPDFREVRCSIDPYEGEEYWFVFQDCSPIFLPVFGNCWPPCEGEPDGNRAEWCD